MKKIVLLAATVALMLTVAPADPAVAGSPVDPAFRGRPYPDCKENTGRVVTLSCVPGAEAGLVGEYGGAGFYLTCNGNNTTTHRMTTTLCTMAGDHTWRLRGAANLRNGRVVDFGPSGSGRTVHYMVGNGEVRLDIY